MYETLKTCNNDAYIQPANLLFYKHLLLVEISPIDKHRLKIEFMSCFSGEKKIGIILFITEYVH